MNNNKEGWIVLKTVGLIEVESEFSISIGGNCDEDSIILLLQVHHLINIYSRMDIMEVKILIEWPFFISNRFLIEIDIEINKETKKENHLNHEGNEFCILYQYSFWWIWCHSIVFYQIINEECIQLLNESIWYNNHSLSI